MTRNEITFLLNMELKNAEDIENFAIKLGKLFNDMKLNPKLAGNFKEIFTDLEKDLEKIQKQVSGGIYDAKDLNKFKSGMQEVLSLQNQLLASTKKLTPQQIAGAISVDPKEIEKEVQAREEAIKAQQAFYAESVNVKNVLEALSKAAEDVGKKKTFDNIKDALASGDFSKINSIIAALNKIKGINITPIVTGLNAAKKEFDGYTETININNAAIAAKAATDEEAAKLQEQLTAKIKQSTDINKDYRDSIEETARASVVASKNIDQLITRFEYFFSFTNAFRLLRRTITSAFNTVKELDAAMTETATVTEYSVREMWSKLDEYTAIANELGATTLGTYKTITLFFQQGLDEQQSLALATETMKMARVAGIDYAEATQYMTSALRGFNMELNETSATRVNDVYSELAKITAADTNQIAIAMSKVASLANSANMELETTSAFLSQIIETTQEAPETAGTALKTIIARFAEVKKLYSEGELIGADEEGEEIDVNKVSVALRKAGINLNDFITGNKGLDDIFLELAQKWSSLDLVTQRYIATMAAGSRQQSRFIAMMQDYDRLIELTNAAYNSAGSGQEQFEKTLDSLGAKLNELKNAWDSFTMSITNSDILKGAVDGLTGLLTIVNDITDSFDRLSGAVKILFAVGFAKIATIYTSSAFTAMKNYQGTDLAGKLAAGRATLGASTQQVGRQFGELISPRTGLINQQNDLQDQFNQLKEKTKGNWTQDQLKQGQKLYQQIKQIDNQLNSTIVKFKQAGGAVQAFGGAAVLAGTAISAMGKKIKNDALVSTGELISRIGAITTGLGTIIRFGPDIINGIKSINASLGTTSTIALGAVGVIITGLVLLNNYLNKVRQDFRTLGDDSTDSLSEMTDQVDQMVTLSKELAEDTNKDTLEWSNNLREINRQYKELIDKYPALKKFVRFDPTTGAFKTLEGYDEYIANRTRDENLVSQASTLSTSVRYGGYKNATTGKVTHYAELDPRRLEGTAYEQLTQEGIDEVDQYIRNVSTVYGTWRGKSNEEVQAEVVKQIGLAGVENFELTEEQKEYSKDQLFDLMISVIQSIKLNEAMNNQEYNSNVENGLGDKVGQNTYRDYANEGSEVLGKQLDVELENHEYADALYKYWETLDKFPETIKNDQNAMKGLALDTGAAIKKFQALADVMNDTKEDTKDILQSGQKNSVEYQAALGKVIKAAQNAYGQALSPKYVRDHIDKFISAFIDGNASAANEIQQDLIKNLNIKDILDAAGFDDISIDPEAFNTIRAQILALTETQEFKLNGVANFDSVYQAFTQLGIHSTKVMQAIIQSMALEAHFAVDENGKMHLNVSNPGFFGANGVKAAGGSGKKSGGGGGGSKQKEKPWENPYDQLYNLTERNEEAIRRRNILEKQYNAILRDREGTSTQLLRNSLQELANLQEQLSYQRQLQRGRKAQLDAVNSEMYMDSEGTRKSYSAWGVTKYAKYNQQTNAIEIDWDAIDRVTDEQTGKAIEDYVKRLEELQKQFEQVDSDILDIEEEIDEINQRGKGEYLDFEQKVYDAIVQTYQDVIDSFSSLNDTINDSNDKILNDLQEQIDLERQIRDNTKTEEEIGDKETRLAYLQRDTSGANATEILRLQEEIADARQNYTDNLIDQKLTQLSKDNDDAAEQRQTQIAIMQEQLDYWAQNGVFWNQVNKLLFEALDKDGRLKNNTQLVELLKETEGFIGMSTFSKENWEDDLAKNFIEAMQGYGSWMIEQAEKKGSITQDGNTYKYDKDKKIWMMGNEAYSAVYNTAAGRYEFTRVKDKDVQVGTIGSGNQTSGGGGGGNGYGGGGGNDYGSGSTDTTKTYNFNIGNGQWTYSTKARYDTSALSSAVTAYRRYLRNKGYKDAMINQITTDWMRNNARMTSYARGGFADFTGPAWLDGSKSKPEAVLSAKQTEMFISLRDLLEHITQSGGLTSNSFGNTYVDLDVNADIGSDYDVDSLVNRLKRDILESSNYRNVNALTRGH